VKLIVGLGNPGPEYEQTPHNLGFLVVDLLAEQAGAAVNNRRGRALTGKARIAGQDVLLAKPETFMNLSGDAVRELVAEQQRGEGFDPRKDLIVIHDELAFPLGTVRLKERGSAGGHNGVESVIRAVGPEFLRVRLGIAPEHPPGDSADYVLTAWKKKQLPRVGEMVDRAAEAVTAVLSEGVVPAMNRFHRRDEADDENE
jgi:PTH1 family peptidyl-tRNA hydrolase